MDSVAFRRKLFHQLISNEEQRKVIGENPLVLEALLNRVETLTRIYECSLDRSKLVKTTDNDQIRETLKLYFE